MKFKDKADYLAQRKALMEAAQECIDKGDSAGANKEMEDVKELDAAFEEWGKAKANLQALSGSNALSERIPTQEDDVNFEGAAEHGKQSIDSAEYKAAWLKAMRGVKLDSKEKAIIDEVNKTLRNEETTANHGILIPTTTMHGIIEAAAAVHPVLQDLGIMDITGDVIFIKDTSPDSDGDWIDEEDESKDADFNEGEVRLSGCELSKSVTISWKLRKMNGQDYEAYLIRKLGIKVGNAIAKAVLKGKGKPGENDTFKAQARGVVTVLEKQEGTPQIVEYTGNISYKDLTGLMAILKSAWKAGSSIYANNYTVWNQLANILDANKRPIFIPDVTTGGAGRIFGLPVKEEDGLDNGEVLVGNYRDGYGFNFNDAMRLYQEEHVKKRKTDFMVYGIADGDVILEEAFALLKEKAGSTTV